MIQSVPMHFVLCVSEQLMLLLASLQIPRTEHCLPSPVCPVLLACTLTCMMVLRTGACEHIVRT